MKHRMKLGRRNDAVVKQFRSLIADRDQARQKLAIAESTIDRLMVDLRGRTLVAIGFSVSNAFSLYGDDIKQIRLDARLKRLTPHGRLEDLGEAVAAECSYNKSIENVYPQTCGYTFEALGAQVFKKVLESSSLMRGL